MTLSSIRVSRIVPFAATALVALAGLAVAGPLTPPVGAVGSTMKTLTEVEPRTAINATNTPGDVPNQFKIAVPGSYYLTADMTVSPGVNPCILVNTSNVTIDLNGYSIRTTANNGIVIAGDHVTIRNGRISMSSNIQNGAGVLIQSGAGESRLEDLTISVSGTGSASVRSQAAVSMGTLSDSILIGGTEGLDTDDSATAWTVTNVQCRGQASSGLIVGVRSVVQDCVVRDVGNSGGNFSFGIYAHADTVIRNCQVADSSVTGVGPYRGIFAGGECVIENCQVRSRGTIGIDLGGSSNTLRNCDVAMETTGKTAVNFNSTWQTVSDNVLYALNGTALQLNASTASTIIRNRIRNTTTPIAGTSLANNIIGPTAGNGNPTASTNPHANFVN